jgi:hypothetical protein
MRLGISLGFAVVCSLGQVGCKTESTPPVYLDANYQLRCVDCEPRTGDDPEREVALLDGESDFVISCDVKRISGKQSLSLSFTHDVSRSSERYGIRITRANIDADDQSNECKVRITEGANIYEGACTGDDPTTEQPCKVSFTHKDEIVSGSIYCDKIPNQGNLASFRYLVNPGSDTKAMKLAVHNCTGL